MHVKIEARIPIFPGTDFHFPSTSVPPGTFLGSARESGSQLIAILSRQMRAIFFRSEISHDWPTSSVK